MEKLASIIKKYPFQTGITIGCLFCLIIALFFGLIFSGGNRLDLAKDMIREDYLRMAVASYIETGDENIAAWRYSHLGRKADETHSLLARDDSTNSRDLFDYAAAVGAEDILLNISAQMSGQTGPAVVVKKNFSPFVMILLIALGLFIFASIAYYLWTTKKTKEKNRRDYNRIEEEYMNKTSLRVADANVFSIPEKQNKKSAPSSPMKQYQQPTSFVGGRLKKQEASEESGEFAPEDKQPVLSPLRLHPFEIPDEEQKAEDGELPESYQQLLNSLDEKPEPEVEPGDEFEDISDLILGGESDFSESPQEHDPVIETAPFEVSEFETDETEEPVETREEEIFPVISPEPAEEEIIPENEISEEENSFDDDEADFIPPAVLSEEDDDEPLLLHFQSRYVVGNDYFDETYSVEEEDGFLGECGIGIGETLNNTDPKAVTAFEVWLFDRTDIHTPTCYLLSDFAMTNESIVSRLESRGDYQRIRKGGKIEITTPALHMLLTVIDLEYGNEVQEKNSYFTRVSFDVKVWKRSQE